MKFSGSQRMLSDINLNQIVGQEKTNVFLVYRLNSYDANNYWLRNGFLGHDNRGFHTFVSFLPTSDLVWYEGDYLTVGPTSGSEIGDLTHQRLTVVC